LGRGAKDPRQQSTKVEKIENTTSELKKDIKKYSKSPLEQKVT
jgi:hypothetical protein